MRRIALLGIWLAATAVAVAVAWGGVQLVARQVVDPVPLAVTGSSPGAQPGDQEPTTGSGTPSPDASPQTPQGPSGESPPAEEPEDAETRTYRLEGGTVSVAFSPSGIRVVQATPRSGFTRKVEPEGTGIKVEFESESHRSRLDAWWDGGPQSETREDRRD